MGFTKLLWDDSDDSNYKSPVEVAVEEKHYDTAEVLLRRMGEERLVTKILVFKLPDMCF